MTRAAIFEAVRATKGRIDPDDVPILDAALDRIGIAPAQTTQQLRDPARFYAAVRQITGSLDTVQVDTINDLLAAAAHWPIGWLAYGLATAWHEARFKPQPEWGKGKGRPYSLPGKHGQAQYGRGLVQLTWDRNYEWADKAIGLNGSLIANFDRALEPAIATAILVKGMEEGAFTGKKLADYIKDRGTPDGFANARRIINGSDKAAQIAGYAEAFQAALDKGGYA
jgi:hypothetical protein